MIAVITYDDFVQVDIRIGTVMEARPFPEARKPAYQLQIDFGPELGMKKSSVQITQHYCCEALVGKQILAVVNFPPKQIGPFRSEVLVLGLSDPEGFIVLVSPDHRVLNGQKLH
jgi:tRNA-binding protein